MKYYTRKPELVEAVQFNGENLDEVIEFCGVKITLVCILINGVRQYVRSENIGEIDHTLANGFFMSASFAPTGNFLREEQQYVSAGDYIIRCELTNDRIIYMVMPEAVFDRYYEDTDSCPLDGSGHCG